MFLRNKSRRPLWLPDKLAPREAPSVPAPVPEPADAPEPSSENEAGRILDEVWSAIELNWAKEEDEPPTLAQPSPESLPDPAELPPARQHDDVDGREPPSGREEE